MAEFFMKELCELGLRRVKFRRLRRYPAVERDFSFIFPDDVPFIEMKKAIWNLDIGEVKELNPIEIFRGGSIPAGKYSILLRVKFQSSERTLREDELAQWSAKIVAALTEFGGLQRA